MQRKSQRKEPQKPIVHFHNPISLPASIESMAKHWMKTIRNIHGIIPDGFTERFIFGTNNKKKIIECYASDGNPLTCSEQAM